MRIRWRDFEIPNSVVCEEGSRKPTYGKFEVEPFERGFGVTVGNSLRRILLSSLEGAALVSTKIEGVEHEFKTMHGVYEDVTEIVLNLKNVLLTIEGDADETQLAIRVDKMGDVTAGDIEHGPEVTIVNPELHIAKLTQDIPLNMDLKARKGRGYSTAAENCDGDNEIGIIWMDSSFSPVSRVRYKTENTRVGQQTNYDRLILEIWTNGALSPEMGLVESAKILRKHLNPFVQYSEIGVLVQPEEQVVSEEAVESPDFDELRKKLEMPISALSLGVRAYNCLDGESIHTVGRLVAWKESDLLKVRNFGQTTLDEIKLRLGEISLNLGMEVPASSIPEAVPAHISPVISQAVEIVPEPEDAAISPEDSQSNSQAVEIAPELEDAAISPEDSESDSPAVEIAPEPEDAAISPEDSESSLDTSAGTLQ